MGTRNSSSEMNKLSKQEFNHESHCCNKIPNYSHLKNFRENEQKVGTFNLNNDHGDGEINPEIFNNSINHHHPDYLAVGECKIQSNNCKSHDHETEPSGSKTLTVIQPLQYTQKMIEDQEVLVATMNQQGIPEPLIRRHFNRLLEEQTKQLQLMGDCKLEGQKKPKNNITNYQNNVLNYQNNVSNYQKNVSNHQNSVSNYQNNVVNCQNNASKQCIRPQTTICNTQENMCNQNNNLIEATENAHICVCDSQININCMHEAQEKSCMSRNKDRSKMCADSTEKKGHFLKVVPSSLLKLRLQKERVNGQRRNNGLQDDSVATEIIQNSKSRCHNQEGHKQVLLDNEESQLCLKLNGTQDKCEMEKFQSMFLPEMLKTQKRQPSQNGLENRRNPNNPHCVAKTQRCHAQHLMNGESGTLYPSQILPNYHQHHPHISNSYNCDNAHENSENFQCNQIEVLPDLVSPNNVHITYHNIPQIVHNSEPCTELLETKVFGGLNYRAVKPHFIPKNNFGIINQTCVSQSE